jgi:ATP-dependent DNA ligase
MEAFADGAELLEVADRHHLEGIVSKRKASPCRSGECRSRSRRGSGAPRAVEVF